MDWQTPPLFDLVAGRADLRRQSDSGVSAIASRTGTAADRAAIASSQV
jgi:hypothetical protein